MTKSDKSLCNSILVPSFGRIFVQTNLFCRGGGMDPAADWEMEEDLESEKSVNCTSGQILNFKVCKKKMYNLVKSYIFMTGVY